MQAKSKQSQNIEKHTSQVLTLILCLVGAFRESHAQAAQAMPQATGQAEHRRKIIVSIPHRKLALVEDGKVKKIYSVAVGAENTPSPKGTFVVKTRLEKPTYYHPGKVIGAGPGNPLGTRWIGLSTKGYGIHGTNVENSVGKAASHGCIRMHRKDLEQLFAAVQVGDEVEIRDAGDDELASIFGELPGATTSTETIAGAMVSAQ